MKLHSSAILLGALTLMVFLNAVQASTPARRFASPNADVLEQLCHRVHLLPIDSLHRARALQSCKNLQETVPHQLQSGPTKDKVEYGKVLEGEKAKYITKTQSREPTPQELANLKALDEAQAKAKKVADDIAAAAATRKSEAVAADQQFMQDQLARQEQVRQQLDDHLKTLLNERNKNAAADAVRQDQLDVDAVANAKAKWTEYEKSLASAKASSAADAKVLESYDAKLKEVQTNWERDAAQRKADFAEAENDKKLADDAAKAARAKAREDRATEMDMRAKQREQDMTTARAERDAALERQRLVDEEAETRAKLKAEQDDAEAALVKNRKNRQDEEAERQKQMDAYAKEEANIKRRREEFEKAEKEREIRAKKRAEDEELRLKAKEEEDLRLAKAREDAAPHEERSKQDDEDDCTDKSVSCGLGKCFQLKSDPKSKRCQCQKGDKGKNCEHAACEYDLEDGAGKKKKQAGNMVNGQCVRWKSEYRCTCDKPWRLDVACVKKEGVKEIEVPKTECKGIREPENEFANQICELCLDQCPISRNLVENTTAVEDHTSRRLVGAECERVVLTCDGRMALSNTPYEQPDAATSGPSSYEIVDNKRECFSKCLERDGTKASEVAAGSRRLLSPEKHCTWVYYEPDISGRFGTCHFFFTGKFPDQASNPNKRQRAANGAAIKNSPTGFIAFVRYPRRWELYRAAGEETFHTPKHFCAGLGRSYDVYFGPPRATTEGAGTYATSRGRDVYRGTCIADQDTVLENAQGYKKKLPSGYLRKYVELPRTWTRYGHRGVRPPEPMVSRTSDVSWTYTVDSDFRVTQVDGLSTSLMNSDRGDSQFDSRFNWVTAMQYYKAMGAPYCAGHVIAYQQKPANSYFNYVPQNPASNSGGCWHRAEESAAAIINLGCRVRYHVDLNYGRNGDLLPSEVKAQLPEWARERRPSSKPKNTKKPPKKPKNPTPKFPSYTSDDLKCHYRFRPFIMNIDFNIESARDNSHCTHLLNALPEHGGVMLRVEDRTVVTTRLFAYLLQKRRDRTRPQDLIGPVGDTVTSLDRMLGAATAMKKIPGRHNTTLSCYAETGLNAPFENVQMDFDFFGAFLGDGNNRRCLMTPGTTRCGKWKMEPARPGNHFGILRAADGRCLAHDGIGGVKLSEEASDTDCGVFVYSHRGSGQIFPRAEAENLGVSIEHLITGQIFFGQRHTQCLSETTTIVEVGEDPCWSLRLSYYKYASDRNDPDGNDDMDGGNASDIDDGDADMGSSGDSDGDDDVCGASDDDDDEMDIELWRH